MSSANTTTATNPLRGMLGTVGRDYSIDYDYRHKQASTLTGQHSYMRSTTPSILTCKETTTKTSKHFIFKSENDVEKLVDRRKAESSLTM